MTGGLTRSEFLAATPLAALSLGAPHMDVRPFRIAVDDRTLDDLMTRLSTTRFPDEVSNAGWDYGTNLQFMRDLTQHWMRGYDWRAREAYLNSFPHFITHIDGYDIHFIHARSANPRAVPLIITHGWPSSFNEMLRIIPLLKQHFHVVVPSVPGYGFSSRPSRPGFVPVQDIWVHLMERLGYSRFAAEGGDIGAGITTRIARFHPDKVIGICVLAATAPYLGPGAAPLTQAEKTYIADGERWDATEGAYNSEQCTKPQTLSYGLNDSPVGLAAWILEKFRSWSDCEGNVEKRFTKDELLDNVMVYWVTQTIGSSVRYYYEVAHHAVPMRKGERITVPTAAAIFPKDLALPPREWLERSYNLQRYTRMPRGGHFAAHEEPELLAEELHAFFA